MKRILSAVLLGVLTSPAFFSGAMAAEANIGNFRFECGTPDGKRLKPKFGDIDGALFIDLPAQREDCIATIQRKIAVCEQNTSFISNTEEQEHAACLPIFEEQAKACVAFFKSERIKCDSGGTDAVTEQAAVAVSVSPKCPDWDDNANGCWLKLSNKPGCYVWEIWMHGRTEQLWDDRGSFVWSGECKGGLASGEGRMTHTLAKDLVEEGSYVDGKRSGRWVVSYYSVIFKSTSVVQGSYVDGQLDGHWIATYGGETHHKCYRAGEEIDC